MKAFIEIKPITYDKSISFHLTYRWEEIVTTCTALTIHSVISKSMS